MKILFLTNIPSPYRVDFFNELGRSVELTVVCERAGDRTRNRRWAVQTAKTFKLILLSGFPTASDKALSPGVLRYLRKGAYDMLVVHNPITPTGMLAIEWLRFRKIPFAVEGDGAFPVFGNRWRDRLKRHLLGAASYWLSSGRLLDQYYVNYGADESRIYRYPFTSVRQSDMASCVPGAALKQKLKEKLGLNPKARYVLSVGRFIPSKGFEDLIRAFSQLKTAARLLIVGGGELEAQYRALIKNLKLDNVQVLGFQDKETLTDYYRASEFTVFPTHSDVWGLVVNESMANGIPVISTDRAVGALEMIRDGDNGFIYRLGEQETLVRRMEQLLSDSRLLASMSSAALETGHAYSIEQMAVRHLEIFSRIKGE